MAKTTDPPAEKAGGQTRTDKGAHGVTVRGPDVERGPRKRLCGLLGVRQASDADLFEGAAARIEDLEAKLALAARTRQ